MNSRLSNQAWLHRDNAACFNSPRTLWHLRRRKSQEGEIETCTFNLYSLATAPCPGTDHSTPSGLGLYADGEVVAALIPGRDSQLASHRGTISFKQRTDWSRFRLGRCNKDCSEPFILTAGKTAESKPVLPPRSHWMPSRKDSGTSFRDVSHAQLNP